MRKDPPEAGAGTVRSSWRRVGRCLAATVVGVMALLMALFVVSVSAARASEAACGVGWTDIEWEVFPPSLLCIRESADEVMVEDRTTTARSVVIGAPAALAFSLTAAAILFRLVAFGSRFSD